MRQHRIYTEQCLNTNTEVKLDDSATKHLIQVLRLTTGVDIVLFNGDGNEYVATLTLANKKSAQAQIKQLLRTEPESKLPIHLGIGLSKGERMEFAIQKSVELGVNRITPLFTKHCVVRLSGERLQKRLSHWQKIIISACEQSNRCYAPTLEKAMPLDEWLEQPSEDQGFILYHRAEKSLRDHQPPTSGVRLLIGPEGGLAKEERELAVGKGFKQTRLGPRVMRTETAPLAAIAAIQTLWGDFR